MMTLLVAMTLLPTPLPDFTFRDWRAKAAYRSDDARLKDCASTASGKVCTFADNSMAGVKARRIGAVFSREGLYALEARFSRADGDVIEAALVQRYGTPCERKNDQVMTASEGMRLVKVRVWCFADGKAIFRSETGPLAEATFQFKTHDFAKQAAVVDF
ncbi:hypothetical protein [Sphingomonas sp. VNH70]|uniref:hypothetical protein n=1 Tax=Sphingomonas silueang TaxID=3156617 RepID=UPI0032B57319